METVPFIYDFPIKTSLHEVLRHRSHGEIFAVMTACCDVRQMLPSQFGDEHVAPKTSKNLVLYMLKAQLVGGFNMLTYPSETYEFVSWDDDIPKIWKIKVMFKTTNQTTSPNTGHPWGDPKSPPISTGHPNERSKGLDWRSGAVKTWLGTSQLPTWGCSWEDIDHWLVVLTILKHMSSSMGRIIPYIVKKKNVPNHQQDQCWFPIATSD